MQISEIYENIDGSYLRTFDLQDIPFEVKRIFLISSSENEECYRGGHAHYKCLQMLTCIAGNVEINYENKESKGKIVLYPGESFYHTNLEWLTLSLNSKNSIIISFCSERYNENDYIRTYEIFQKEL